MTMTPSITFFKHAEILNDPTADVYYVHGGIKIKGSPMTIHEAVTQYNGLLTGKLRLTMEMIQRLPPQWRQLHADAAIRGMINRLHPEK